MELYKIANEMSMLQIELETCIDEETGEVSGDLFERLTNQANKLDLFKSKKIIEIGKIIKNLTAERDAHVEEQRSQRKKAEILTKKVDALKGIILLNIDDDEMIGDSAVKISKSKRLSVILTGPASGLPVLFQKRSETITADKTMIKGALESGQYVPGAHLQRNLLVK